MNLTDGKTDAGASYSGDIDPNWSAGTINGPAYTLAGAILQSGDPVVTTINGDLMLEVSSIPAYGFASPTGPTPTV